MAFHLPLRARPERASVPVRDARHVVEADWADAARSLERAQVRYQEAIEGASDAATYAAATAELMRARTRIEMLRRASLPEAARPTG